MTVPRASIRPAARPAHRYTPRPARRAALLVGVRRRRLLTGLATFLAAGCARPDVIAPPAAPSPSSPEPAFTMAPPATMAPSTTAEPTVPPRAPSDPSFRPWTARATPAVAADYTWLTTDPGFTGLGFCLTWLRAVPPREFADRMSAHVLGAYRWDSLPDPGDNALVAITDTGQWSVMVEYNGVTAIEDRLITRLSRGSRLVANYRNVEFAGRFVLVDNGVIVADFDPATPDSMSGSDPHRIRAAMAGLGLEDKSRRDYTQAALVLTERLTGVPLTSGHLHQATFLAATIPDPLR